MPLQTTATPVRRILAPIDFSAPSQRSLIHALGVAHETGAHLGIIHVADTAACPPGYSAHEYLKDRDTRHGKIKEKILQLLARLWPRPFAGKLEVLVKEGIPSREIIEAALDIDADLIVISTHGRSGFKRFLLGSTADKVVRFAPCSVLMVKRKSKEELPPEISESGNPG